MANYRTEILIEGKGGPRGRYVEVSFRGEESLILPDLIDATYRILSVGYPSEDGTLAEIGRYCADLMDYTEKMGESAYG